jgi:hypothetical protein
MKVRSTQWRSKDIHCQTQEDFSDDDVRDIDIDGMINAAERKKMREKIKAEKRKLKRWTERQEKIKEEAVEEAEAEAEKTRKKEKKKKARVEARVEARGKENKAEKGEGPSISMSAVAEMELQNPNLKLLEQMLDDPEASFAKSPIKMEFSLASLGGPAGEEEQSDAEPEVPIPVEEMDEEQQGSVRFLVGDNEIHLPRLDWVVGHEEVAAPPPPEPEPELQVVFRSPAAVKRKRATRKRSPAKKRKKE